MTTDAELAFYTAPGPLTALDAAPELAALGDHPQEVAAVVQGLLLHDAWSNRYGVEVMPERRDEVQLRPAAAMVQRVRALDPAPLTQSRSPERRLLTNCRGFSVLGCALLRQVGVPARARCGFADYFEPGRFVDHWVLERWDATMGRWVLLDAQLDDLQRQALGLDFDPGDLPPGRFLSGGEAWRRCRAGEADPVLFGIFEWWGAWFVRNNVIRDVAALSKVELLPWDQWGLMDRGSALGEGPEDGLVDEVAALAAVGDWAELRPRYLDDDRLRAPSAVVEAVS